MHAIQEWIKNNPILFLAIWPVFTGILTSIFRKRTPEEYAAMNPRLAGLVRGLSSIGFDVPKFIEALWTVLTGAPPKNQTRSLQAGESVPPPTPKKPPPVPPVSVLMMALICISCTPAQRQAAFGAITDVGSCIVNQLVAGNEDPKGITGACIKSTLDDVGHVVDSLIADANKNAPEGGMAAVAPTSFYARLQRVKAKLGDGG